METILGKSFAQAQVHTEFIAQVPKSLVGNDFLHTIKIYSE